MAFNVLSYTQNVAKSITYATVDKVKKMNPVLEEFMDTNADLSKQVFSSIKDFRGTVRKGKDWLVKQDLYEAADIGFHAVIDDIRSGKFYNRERIDEMNNRAAGSLTEGLDDMMGDPFAEIDGNDSGGNIKESQMEQELSRDTQSTLEVMDNVGSKVTNGVAMATMANAETISKTNIKIAQKNQAHNEFLTNKLSVGMGAINSTIASLIEFNNKVVHPYIEGSIKWQSDLMSAHNETNALLKEIIANQQKAITPETEQKKRENITLQSIGEVPDLKEYGKLIWKNIMDQTGGVLDMFNAEQNGGINPLFTLVASPLQKIPEAIVNTFIPKMVEKAAEDLNEGMEGFFASAIAKFNRMADDDSEGSFISNLIGKVFGIQSAGKIKSRPDINAIGKKAIAWDQESKHALTRVIPDTLAKILAAQTKTTAQLFDYNTGMYTSMDAINEKYDPKKLVEDAAIAATREYMEPIKDMIESVKFGEDDYQLREDIYKALNDMAVQMYNTDRVITPELVAKLMKDDREIKLQQTMGLSGYSDEVVQLIAGAITGLGGFNGKTRINKDFIKSIQTLNREIFNKKAGMKRDMDALSQAGSLALNMQNNYNADEYRDDAFIMKKGRTAYSSDQQLKQQLNPMKDIGYSILARQKDMSNLLVSIDQVLHDGINVSHVDTVRWVDHVAGRGERIFDTPNRSHVYRGADGRRQYVPNQPPSGPNVVPTGDYNSRNQHIAFDSINKVNTLREDTAERAQRDREYALSRHNRRADELQKHGARIAQYNQMEQNLAYRDTNSDSDAESQAIYKSMIAHTLSNADYRKYQQAVKENKAKEGKMTPISWFKQLMNIDDDDAKANTFLNGLEELSQKPAQFLTNVIHRIDERFYNVVFGEDDEDKLAPKSFMNQLTTRLGYIFRDFSGFLKDEVFAPLKDTLFGEEGYFSKATEWAKDKLNIEDGDIMDFIFGKVDENGERHGGMFGDKINFAKSSMKEVYGELGDILVPVDGKYAINQAGLEKAEVKKGNRVIDKYGNDTGMSVEQLYDLFQKDIADNGTQKQNLEEMLSDFKKFSGGTDITAGWYEDVRKSVEKDIAEKYKDKYEIVDGKMQFNKNFTADDFNNLVNQAAIQKVYNDRYAKGDKFRNFDQYTVSKDDNFEALKNHVFGANGLISGDWETFKETDQFKNKVNYTKARYKNLTNDKKLTDQQAERLALKLIMDDKYSEMRQFMDKANRSVYEDYDQNAADKVTMAINTRVKASDIVKRNEKLTALANKKAQLRGIDLNSEDGERIYDEVISTALKRQKKGLLDKDTLSSMATSATDLMNFSTEDEIKENKKRLRHLTDLGNKLHEQNETIDNEFESVTDSLNKYLGFTLESFKEFEKEVNTLKKEYYDNVKEFRKAHADEGLTKDQMNDLINQDQALMELRDQLSRSEGELNYKRGKLKETPAVAYSDKLRELEAIKEKNSRRIHALNTEGRKSADKQLDAMMRYKGYANMEEARNNGAIGALQRKDMIDSTTAAMHAKEGEKNGINSFAKGGMVRKTGVIAASEGELIIPAKYNPFYHGSTGLSESLKKENKAIDQYLASFGGNFNIRNFAGPYPSTITADDLEGQGEVVDVQIEQLTEGSKKKKKRKFGNMGDSTNPEDYKYGFGKRLALKTTDRAMDAIKRRKTNRTRNKNFKKLNSEQQALIREYGYDGRYNELNEYAQTLYDNGDFEGVLEAIGKLEEGVNAAAEDNAAEKYESNKERLFKGMLDSAKETIGDHFPSLIGSGLIGAGVSLVTGAVGGPLLGAAIGAGTDLAIKSEGVKNWLFGEYDDDGRRKGNIISKDLANNIEKYLPGMAKGAIAGGITSILPFVPGGPVSGIILGSAIGFAKNNEKIKNTLFGYMDEEHNEWHDGILPKNFIEKLQGVVPDAVLGMLGGATGTAILGGPFGLVGNMALGGAIGILVSTETFQDKLFGKKDPATGIRQGGLLGAVKEGFVDPLIDTGKSIKDKLVDWFKRDIAHPLASAIRPLAKQGGLLLGGIATGISRIVGDKFANEIGGGFSGLGHFLREKVGNLARAGLGIAQATARPVGKMISAPTRFIGNLGERFRKRHVADGDATYMTAKQRLQYRQELEDNVVYKKYDSDEYDEDGYLIHRKGDVMVDDLGQPIKDGDRGFKYFHNTLGRGKMKKRGKHADKFAQFDEMLVGMNKDELGELRDAVNYLKDPNQEAQRQRKKSVDTINDVVHNKYGLSYKESKHLLSLFRDGEIDKASNYIGKLGLTEDDEVALRNTLTQQYSIYQASDETLTKSKGFRSQLYKELKDMGLNINDKNLDKHLRLIDQEYNEKDKMDPIQKLDENQKERHQEIVDLFNKAIDTIKAMNDEEFREELIKRDAAKNKRAMEVKSGLLGRTFNKVSRNHLANSGALWGRNYEMEYVEDPETGEQQWYMVNKKTLERTQVDAAGNPVDGSARPIDVQLNTVGRRARKAIGRNVANAFRKSGAWNKLDRVHPIKDRRDKKHESAKEEAIMGMIIDYVNQNSDNINVPDDTRYTYIKNKNGRYKKVERINWVLNWLGVDNYTDAAEALKEKYNVDILSDNKKYGSEDDRRSYFRHKISQETGISAKKLKRRFATHKRKHGKNKGKDRGGFAYKDDNGNMHSLDEEDWYNDHSGNYSGEKGGHIVGEEADVLNKRRTVFDLFANPITVVRGKDGRWVQDQNDSDNKKASLVRDTLLTMGDKISTKIGGLAKDVKDGFLHFFNIDAERDGWLKTMLKVGTGVLGVLTAAGVAARSQTWWEERIKPALVGWYKAHVYPTLERWLEPIRPGIAKLAIGIDSTIQRIPNAIHSLGDRIKGFITDDLPSIWATKILPFYQDGYNWLINNVSTIVEKVVYNTVKVAPAIITGAIKGATKFLSNDILTIITGLGRRDANGIKTSLTNSPAINGALAGIDTLSSAADGLRSFNGASKIASALGVRQSDFDRASGSYGTVSESSLAGFYANDDLTQEHPSSSSDSSTFDGYAAMDTPTTSQSKKGTSTSTANFGNNANNNNAPSLDVSTMVNYSAGLASSSGSTSIDPASEKAIDDAYRENKKNTSPYNNSTKNTTTNASNASNNKASNSISNTAYKVGATAAAALRNVQNSITANNNNEGLRTSKATVVSDNGVYNTTDSLRAGSSAGISLYNASYDQATGLVYSQNGEFIPNAYYDPATGNITDSPTHSALQQWPNITHSHDFALEEALNSGALDPAAYYGSDMPETGGEPDWMGITLNNLKDTFVNVGNMIGNKNSIGGRLTGLSTLRDGETPTGLLRTAITGQTGVVGRIINHTAESWSSKKGLVRRSLAKPLGKLDKAFTYASDNSVLSRLNGKWNRSINNATSIVQNAVENTDLNDLKERYKFNSDMISEFASDATLTDSDKAYLKSLTSENDNIIKEATEKLNKGIINGATDHLDDAAKEAIKAANANSVDEILKAANNAAHGNGSLFSNIKSNLDNFFESFTKSSEAKSLLSTLSKTGGIPESAVREQFENVSDALAKEASNVAERAGKSVAGKLARLTPLVNFAFYAVDFATGCANANNYLGISDNAMANMDLGIPSWFLRIIIGLAHVISQNFLLGIIPTSSICDVFTSYLLPLFGVDMTEYNKAIELSQIELEKYREETGDEFAKLEDLNNYTSMSQTFLRTIGLVEDAKKNSRYASRRGGTDVLNNLMSSGGKYKSSYNGKPSQSTTIKPKELTQSDINALKASIKDASSGKGSGLLSGRASTAIHGLTSPSSYNITSTATFDTDMYKDDLVAYQKYNGNNSLTMGDLFNYYSAITNAYYNGTIRDRNNIYNQEYNSDMTNYVRQTVLKNPSADMSDVFNYYKSQCDKYANYMNTHTHNEIIHFNDYSGSGSGIGGFGYHGSGNRFYRPYSSIGSINDMIPKGIPQRSSMMNRYVGSGSGIAGTSNPSSYIVSFIGAGSKNKTKLKQISEDSINISRTTNIVSESARIAMYMQSRGNIANMTLEKDNTYSIGCVGWNNKDAITFLKGLLKTKPSAFKKVLGNKLYNLINSAKKFKKDTFNQFQLDKIRAILSTEESKSVQIKTIKRLCKKYINEIKTVYNNAQTVLFLSVLSFKKGIDSKVIYSVKKTELDFSSFYTKFTTKNTDLYGNNKDYLDQLYQLVSNSGVLSTDTTGTVKDSDISSGMGVTDNGSSGSSSSSSESGSWLERLKTAITNMGNALFGIDSYGKEGSSNDNSETTNYGGKNDTLKDQEKIVDNCQEFCDRFNNPAYTLKERINYLREAFEIDVDLTVENFSKGADEYGLDLIHFLYNSKKFQKLLEKYQQAPSTDSNKLASLIGSAYSKLSSIGQTDEVSSDDSASGEDLYAQYKASNITYGVGKDKKKVKYADTTKTLSAEVGPQLIKAILKDKDFANGIYTEFSNIANNVKAASSVQDAQFAAKFYLNSYIVNDKKAKDTPFYNMLMYGENSKKIIKEYYGDRLSFIQKFSEYIKDDKNGIGPDWESKAFASKKDRAIGNLGAAMAILNDSSSDLDSKEFAWDSGVNAIADLLGIENTLDSTSINSSIAKKNDKIITTFSKNGKRNKKAFNNGFNMFSESIMNSKKTKNKELIKSTLALYPNVTDFNSLFNVKGKPKDVITPFAANKYQGLLNENLIKAFNNSLNNGKSSKTVRVPYMNQLSDDKYKYLKELSGKEVAMTSRKRNIFNPYTVQKLMLENKYSDDSELYRSFKSNNSITFGSMYDYIMNIGETGIKSKDDKFSNILNRIKDITDKDMDNAEFQKLVNYTFDPETAKAFVLYYNNRRNKELKEDPTRSIKGIDYKDSNEPALRTVGNSLLPRYLDKIKLNKSYLPFRDYIYISALKSSFDAISNKRRLMLDNFRNTYPTGWFSGFNKGITDGIQDLIINGQNLIKYQDTRENTAYKTMYNVNDMKTDVDKQILRTMIDQVGENGTPMIVPEDTGLLERESIKEGVGIAEEVFTNSNPLVKAGIWLSKHRDTELDYSDGLYSDQYDIFNQESEFNKQLHNILAMAEDANKRRASFKLYYPAEGNDLYKFGEIINKASSSHDEFTDYSNVDSYFSKTDLPSGDKIGSEYASEHTELITNDIPVLINAYTRLNNASPKTPFIIPDDAVADLAKYTEGDNSASGNWYPHYNLVSNAPNLDIAANSVGKSVPTKYSVDHISTFNSGSQHGISDIFSSAKRSPYSIKREKATKDVEELKKNATAHHKANAGKGTSLRDMITAKGNNFISQLDYKNMKFSDGESMADAGCGPAVAAMAINGLSGGASMMETAALADKYKTNGGTSADYFQDVFSRAGAKTTYYEGSKASSGAVKSLKAGQQVVLLGQDRNNKSKANSPFGPGNHYVLAKGMSNGKVAINDPEQHGTKIYNKNILKNTKLSMAVSGKGSGLTKFHGTKLNNYVGAGKSKTGGTVYKIPGGCGTELIYQEQDSLAYKAGKIIAASTVDEYGFRKVNGRYCVSITPFLSSNGKYTYSGANGTKKYDNQDDNMNGRYFDAYLSGGIRIPCIVCDIKGKDNTGPNADYGHHHGKNVLEFVKCRSKKWPDNPGTSTFVKKYPKFKKWNSGGYGPKRTVKVVISDYTWFQDPNIGKDVVFAKDKVGTVIDGSVGSDGSSKSGKNSNTGTWMDRIINNINIMGKALLGMDEDGNGGGDTASGYVGTGLASDVVKVAKAELGYKPSANNQSKYSKEFGVSNAQWCAYFVSWVFKKACGGVKKMKKVLGTGPVGSVTALLSTFRSKGMLKKNPHVGDVVIWKEGRSHTGIVISVNTKKKTFTTVEGNTGNDEVGKRTYSFSNATGFGRPNYESGSGSGITADSAYNSLLRMSGKGSNISKSGLNIDLTKSEKEIFDQIVSASDKAAMSSASGKGSRMSNSVIRNTNNIQATDLVLRNAARGSSIGSRSNARAISRISNSGNFVYSGAGSNLIKSGINRSYGRGTSDSPTMNDIYETSNRINSSYDSDYSTYIDPDTGEELMLDEVYSGGASKKKAKKRNKAASKHAVNTVKQGFKTGGTISTAAETSVVSDENTRNYILLRSMLTLLKSIEKSERKNADIVTILKKMYSKMGGSTSALNAILKNSKSKSSHSDKKKAKGSELYSGKAAQMANRMNNSSSSDMARLASITQSHSEDEYSEMNELIKELTRITMD